MNKGAVSTSIATLDEQTPFEDFDYDSDKDPDYEEETEHSSESQQSDSEDESFIAQPKRTNDYYYGKNDFKWQKQPPAQNTRTRCHNIIVQLPGLRQYAKVLGENPSPVNIWHLLLTEEITNEVLRWTNVKISQVRANYSDLKNASYTHDIDEIELKALFGLFLFTAIFKSSNESVESLFSTDGCGRDIFRCTMPLKRFLFLLISLRFDNSSDREERKKVDKCAAISKIFYQFIENCQKCLSLGPYVTIDEMLVPFRGHCGFRLYMPNKPAKYGLKIMCLTDAKSGYLYNAYIYSGKGSDGEGLNENEKIFSKPTQSVLRLTNPIAGSRRNVTADNWFSSVEVVNELRKKGITYLGTVKKNKREIPPQFLPNRNREVNSYLHGFNEDKMTLLSYVTRKSKCVILLSSMHHSPAFDNEQRKPEMVVDYNSTKGGVDSLDQKCANYTAGRRTRRWPMAIFFRILDIAAANCFELFKSYKNTPQMTRYNFTKVIANALTEQHTKRRLLLKNIPRELKYSIRRVLGISENEINQEENNVADYPEVFERRKTCSLCPPRLKRKTQYPCIKCQRPICLTCSKKICKDCV